MLALDRRQRVDKAGPVDRMDRIHVLRDLSRLLGLDLAYEMPFEVFSAH